MIEKYLNKLEFNKICEILKGYSLTYIGKDLITNLAPIVDKQDLEKALKQTSEASILLFRKGSIPISEIANLTSHIKKLNSSMGLSIKELLDLGKILKISNDLKEYFNSSDIEMDEFVYLKPLFENLYVNPSIEKEVLKAIIDEETISDDASKTLSQIRRNIKNKEQDIRTKLTSYLKEEYIQDPVITIRNSRFVIPVKLEYKGEIKGFIHDTSQSGQTLFIEPIAVFELNNELNKLKIDEQVEIEKILYKLSSLFFDKVNEIENNASLIGLIDFIFAKAKYSNSRNMTEPIILDEKIIDLKKAYHPLLSESVAVKNDISIGNGYTSLVITGPNTGGKTVMLKTVGLVSIMALSGMHIPAGENSKVYHFDNIFADIGDEQSIQDSLSTFSSHMTTIANILENATTDSLVLLDEVGSGTDPVEGSSLAISILESLKKKDTLTLSTTHYPELKHYCLTEDGFENASVEFDLEKMSPTYKLLLGVPGTSNAFSISKKLGIDEKIINRAKELLSNDNVKIEELLTNIYEDKREIEIEKEETKKALDKAKEYLENTKTDFEESKTKERDIIDKAKKDAQKIILDAKDEVNDIIKQLENAKSASDANKLRNKLNDSLNNLSSNTVEKTKNPLSKEDLKVGLKVYVPSLNQSGEIISISKGDKVQVRLPLGKMSFNYSDLEKDDRKVVDNSIKTFPKHRKDFEVKAISPEINLLGQTVDEACLNLDKYLDTAALAGLESVRVVHGKGTGALRKGVQEYLSHHPHVKSYRIGMHGEGDAGVTIVILK